MSGHPEAASADLAAQNYLDSDDIGTLPHDAEPDSEIHLKSNEEPAAETYSESQRNADAEETVQREHDNYSDNLELSAHNQQRPPRIYIGKQEWMNYLRENPMDRDRIWSDVYIFKVGEYLKDIKREAYVPQQVSLGPYHHGRRNLLAMNIHKDSALLRMMIRYNTNMGIDPNDMVFASRATEVILHLQDRIKAIYQEIIPFNGEPLAQMLCSDGCFILEILRTLGRDSNDPNEDNHPIFGKCKIFASIVLKDILMLENQIPCIVLQELLRLEQPNDADVGRTLLKVLLEGTFGLFKFSKEDALMQCDWSVQPVHLLGFLHKVIVHWPSNRVNRTDHAGNCIDHCLIMLQHTNEASNDTDSIPPAVELKHAGIKFLPFEGGIKDIVFDPNSSTIYLPPVSITYGIEVLLRNLIAFEICRPSEGNYVTSYVALMNDLIDSKNDVALLRKQGILAPLLGSEKEVADLFNGLCNKEGVKIEDVFDQLRKDVNAHYKNKFRIHLAEVMGEYFSSPLKAFGWAVAVLFFILTLIQAIFAIMKN